ncbi:MAG: DUF1801 domain-containing protein [Bacteroidetes bacterium]|nr:DUF1801 domain-containing protein [Bacteroidota bacterium]
MTKERVTDVDSYIKNFPSATQKKLQQIRSIIKKSAPVAKEIISYQMPAYKLNQVLVYYAGYEKHIGFYPTSAGIEKFEKEFIGYKYSKGAVQLPLDKPLPVELIKKIVQYRLMDDKKSAGIKNNTFMDQLSAPLRRALNNHGIKTLKQLSGYTENDILKWHGIGKTSISKLQVLLKAAGLYFKNF